MGCIHLVVTAESMCVSFLIECADVVAVAAWASALQKSSSSTVALCERDETLAATDAAVVDGDARVKERDAAVTVEVSSGADGDAAPADMDADGAAIGAAGTLLHSTSSVESVSGQ